MPFGLNLVRETTIFREYGPLAGHTMSLGYEYAPERGQPAVPADPRRRRALLPCGSAPTACWRFRARGYKSWGEFPGYLYFGGNSEMRGYDYLSFLGNKGFFTDAELRFPIIEAALTPIGVVGGLRGVFFFNFGAAGYEGVDDEGVDETTRPSRRRSSTTPSIRRRRASSCRCMARRGRSRASA